MVSHGEKYERRKSYDRSRAYQRFRPCPLLMDNSKWRAITGDKSPHRCQVRQKANSETLKRYLWQFSITHKDRDKEGLQDIPVQLQEYWTKQQTL